MSDKLNLIGKSRDDLFGRIRLIESNGRIQIDNGCVLDAEIDHEGVFLRHGAWKIYVHEGQLLAADPDSPAAVLGERVVNDLASRLPAVGTRNSLVQKN